MDGQQESTGGALKRRSILAAAGAVVAGMVAKQTSQPVAASAPFVYANTATQANNAALGQTNLNVTLAADQVGLAVDVTPSAAGFDAMAVLGQGSNHGPGVMGLMDGVAYPGPAQYAGVYGAAGPSAAGVIGVAGPAASGSFYGTGVMGVAYGATALGSGAANATAVVGNALGTTMAGVRGYSESGVGVYGSSSTSHGLSGTSISSHGVSGVSDGGAAANGCGVYGLVSHVGSTQVTAGVFGDSYASYGVVGRTTAVNYSGCTGIADGANRSAFAGAGTNGAYAAYFTGPTVVNGDFTVVGGHQKNAAVKHSDGSYRLLHCVESPEPWFEDVGEAKLVNGKADVKLDADFADVVDVSSYHVFLTPRDAANKGLAVTTQRGNGFTVQELNGGASSGTFSYRVMAKRKDIKVGRLAKFELPKIRLPKPEEMPPPPTQPKKP